MSFKNLSFSEGDLVQVNYDEIICYMLHEGSLGGIRVLGHGEKLIALKISYNLNRYLFLHESKVIAVDFEDCEHIIKLKAH